MLLPLSLFFKMCYVLTCAFFCGIKSRCVWLNVKQCTPSSTGRHRVYTASRQSSSVYGCNSPKSSKRATALGSLSETWYRDLQLLEGGSEKIRQTVIRETFSDSLIICCDDIFWKGGWLGALIRNYARYLEEINIREDKLLLYHCLLELGTLKSQCIWPDTTFFC
jgi:hypothetical protein